MVFASLTEHRRRSILTEPFPPAWIDVLCRDMPIYACLTHEEQSRLRDLLRIFISEKNWEGCGSMTLTDEIKVAIAGQACLLILNLDREIYPNVESILVYPNAFVAKQRSITAERDALVLTISATGQTDSAARSRLNRRSPGHGPSAGAHGRRSPPRAGRAAGRRRRTAAASGRAPDCSSGRAW